MSSENEKRPTTCGECAFARMFTADDISKRYCFGTPPTPILLAATRSPTGQVAMQLENVRAIVGVSDPACALGEKKVAGVILR